MRRRAQGRCVWPGHGAGGCRAGGRRLPHVLHGAPGRRHPPADAAAGRDHHLCDARRDAGRGARLPGARPGAGAERSGPARRVARAGAGNRPRAAGRAAVRHGHGAHGPGPRRCRPPAPGPGLAGWPAAATGHEPPGLRRRSAAPAQCAPVRAFRHCARAVSRRAGQPGQFVGRVPRPGLSSRPAAPGRGAVRHPPAAGRRQSTGAGGVARCARGAAAQHRRGRHRRLRRALRGARPAPHRHDRHRLRRRLAARIERPLVRVHRRRRRALRRHRVDGQHHA